MHNSFVVILHLLISILINPCRHVVNNNEANIQGIRLSYEISFKTLEGKDEKMKNEIDILYLDSDVMVKVPHQLFRSETKYNQDLNVDNTVNSTDTAYKYFIYRKDGQFGLMYDSLSALKPIRFSVDSLLAKKAFKSTKFYDKEKDSLIKSYKPKEHSLYSKVEVYNRKLTDGRRVDNEVFLYYSDQFSNINYTFSPELDSRGNEKISKVIFLFNPLSPEETKKTGTKIPRQEMVFQMKQISVENKQSLMELFARFSKDATANKL